MNKYIYVAKFDDLGYYSDLMVQQLAPNDFIEMTERSVKQGAYDRAPSRNICIYFVGRFDDKTGVVELTDKEMLLDLSGLLLERAKQLEGKNNA